MTTTDYQDWLHALAMLCRAAWGHWCPTRLAPEAILRAWHGRGVKPQAALALLQARARQQLVEATA